MKPLTILLLLSFSFIQPLSGQFRLNVQGDAKFLGRLDIESAGTHNVFAGFGAGIAQSTGQNNAFFGYRAGYLNTSGNDNTFLGYEAGRNSISSDRNTALGFFTLASNQTSSKNVAIGARALLSLVDGYGLDPQANNQDLGTIYNLAIGTSAGLFTNDPTRLGAERNTFVGNNSGLQNTIGYRNAFFGFQSGDSNVSGDYNTCIGHEADLTANDLFNAGAFGSLAVVNASNKIRIGDASVNTIEGNGWSLPSDGRFKTNIQEDVPGLDFVMALRPVTYQFDVQKYNAYVRPDGDRAREDDPKHQEREEHYRRASEVIQTGFIAQEVEAAAEKTGFDFSGLVKPKNSKDNYGLSYSLFVVPLVKGLQEQQGMIRDLEKANEDLHAQNALLEERITRLEALVAGKIDGFKSPVKIQETVLADARLFQNRPNPFNQQTTITYFIPEGVQNARLEVLNIDGRPLKSWNISDRESGEVILEAGRFPAGSYVYQLILDGEIAAVRTMVLTR